LKLNNREYEKHYKNKCEAFHKELQCDVPVTVIKDVSVKAGGLILESETSFVDASVDTQLKRIANSFTQRDKQYHEAL
jgi:flagellar biosynthesis/type III secretory pathway protein FliH